MAFAVRAAAWAVAPSPEFVLAAAPLGGVGFAFFYVGTVTYIAGAVPRSVQATAQGIFTATAFMVGVVLGSIIGGLLAGPLTLAGLFAFAALGTGLGAAVIWRSSRSAQPLIAVGAPTPSTARRQDALTSSDRAIASRIAAG